MFLRSSCLCTWIGGKLSRHLAQKILPGRILAPGRMPSRVLFPRSKVAICPALLKRTPAQQEWRAQNAENWWCILLGGILLAFILKYEVMSTVVGLPYTSPIAKYCNNDAFAPHSAPLALTATINMDRQRRFSSLSVWVHSGLGRWLHFYGDGHILFLPSRTCHTA